MKLSSANILRSGKREIRALGDTCDASCAMWFACSNSVPNGTCTGYANLNGKSKMLLDKNLNQDDLIYIQNCAQMAQGECNEETREALAKEVLRFIPHEEPERKEGFIGMVECALGLSNTSAPEQEPTPETRSTEGFRGMLDAISRSEQPHTVTLTRAIDESQFPPLCNPMSCPPNYARHCSANRPEHHGKPCIYRTPTNEEIKQE